MSAINESPFCFYNEEVLAMKTSDYEISVLVEQYQKVVEQISEQGFVNQLLGADIVQRLINLANYRLAKDDEQDDTSVLQTPKVQIKEVKGGLVITRTKR